MVIKTNRKGAVEMSISLIIMLVIGLTIMGLIISFVTNSLGGVDIPVTQDDKIKQEQASKIDGNFGFLANTLTIEKEGDESTGKLYMKVRNPTTVSDLELFGGGAAIEGDSTGFTYSISLAGTSGYEPGGIEVFSPLVKLDSGQGDAYTVLVKVNEGVEIGTYFLTFSIDISDKTYTDTITLEIK